MKVDMDPTMLPCRAWIKDYDPTRFIHYQGAFNKATDIDYPCVDMKSRMYFPIDTMIALANESFDTRPVMWCEYAHSMGNSTGSLYKFWDAIRGNHRLIGGFIWDWKDQGIYQVDKNGKSYWAYGGDFGDTINSENFCINGIVGPDQSIKPAILEAKKVMQPVEITGKDLKNGIITVKNWHHVADLSRYSISWELLENGIIIKNGVAKQ